jgi:hypothetical protein
MLLTARMAEALKSGAPRIVLVEIDHPAGVFRCWTGIGQLSWNGQVWTGIGILGQIAPVRSTNELAIQEIVFSLSGVEPESLALLEGSVRNRTGVVWLACLDEQGLVVADPLELLTALLDYQSFSAQEDGTATVSIVARSGFYTLERALDEAWTPENQYLTYPLDTGLDMQPSLQNQQVNWTRT